MKKITTLLFCFLLTLCLTGCTLQPDTIRVIGETVAVIAETK